MCHCTHIGYFMLISKLFFVCFISFVVLLGGGERTEPFG